MNSVILSQTIVFILYCLLIILSALTVFFRKGRFYFAIASILLLSAFIITTIFYKITLVELITSLLIFITLLGGASLLEKRIRK